MTIRLALDSKDVDLLVQAIELIDDEMSTYFVDSEFKQLLKLKLALQEAKNEGEL